MRNLIFFFLLISFCAFSQKTPATLISENDATTYSAPFRIRNAFNDQILSNVNQRVPVFLDSADITKRIKFYFNGSHPTATTYNVTWPNKSGTVAFLDDVGSGVTKAGNGIILAAADSVVADTVKMAQKSDLSGWLTGTLTGDVIIDRNSVGGSISFRSNGASGYSITLANSAFGVGLGSNFIGITNNQIDLSSQDALVAISTNGVPRMIFYNNGNIRMDLPSSSTGDMIYRNSSNNLNRLAKGAEGTLLRAGASVPAYSTFTIPNTISALSTFVSNSANVLTEITPSAGQSIRVNAGGTAWEAYTPSGGVSDGDKGDITVSGSGATWTIDNTAVTYGKIQNVAANSFLANATGSSATVQEIATNRIPLFSSAITGTPSSSTYLRGDGSWQTISSGSSVLSDITAATGTNTIDNGANHQIWDWDSLTSGTGMSFRSSSTGADSSTLKVVSIEKSGANANSSQTTTALNVSNTSTGTSATNIAGRFTASGGTNNYALDIVGGINWSNDGNLSTWTQTHTGTHPGINLVTNRNAVVSQFGIQNTNGGASAETRFRLAGASQIGWLAMAGGNNTSAYGEGNRMALWNSANAGIIFGTNNTGRAVFTNDNKFVFGATSITSGADFDVNGNVIFSGSSRYLNFGTTAGSSGYGIRDNSGVIEFKNSGQTWTPLGYLQPQEESGTSFTLDDLDITQGIYTSNGSAVTITVPSDLPIGAVVTIMQEGAGAVSLSAGANVNIAGKTSTTGATDFIWLWLYKKDGGISYYVGR